MPHYATEANFRTALTTRLRQLNVDTGWEPTDVARAFMLQQLTSRLFRSDSAHNWVLKGGTALQYRSTEARPTMDADFSFAAAAGELHDTLSRALTPREGEYGTFDIGVAVSADRGQHTVRVSYLIDGKRLSNAKLDVNTARAHDFEPDTVTPAPFLSMPDLPPPPPMRVYPVARHLADKVAAMYEMHGAAEELTSTRPHDLADIVILARSVPVDAHLLRTAIHSEAGYRGVTVPIPLTLPEESWVQSYPPRVARSRLPAELHDARTALDVANTLLTPVLNGDIQTGTWDPMSLTWSATEQTEQPSPAMRELFRAARPNPTVLTSPQSENRRSQRSPLPPSWETQRDTGFSL